MTALVVGDEVLVRDSVVQRRPQSGDKLRVYRL